MTRGTNTLPTSDEVLHYLRREAPEPGMVRPDYRGYATCNVSQLMLRNFNLPNRCPDGLAPLLDRQYRRIVLLIVDALGWNQLHAWVDELPPLSRLYDGARVVPLTSTFPSTTTVALSALYTGMTPAEHSITGHYLYLREIGAVMDVLRFSPYGDPRREVYAERGVDVHALFPMQTLFQPFQQAGLLSLSVTRGIFTNTALGWLHHVGAEVVGYLTGADMFVHVRHALQRQQEGVVCVYWDVVDMLSHEYGPRSEEVRCSVEQCFYSLEREILEALSPAERSETLLLITADHGQCDLNPEEAVFLAEHPRLAELLMLPPTGQGRAAYLYADRGQVPALGRELERFEEALRVYPSEEALATGLFGPPELARRIRARVGDYVALSRGGAILHGADVTREQFRLRGHHGLLSEDEMLVPLLAVPLDRL
ncbi:MAG: alkaline phosphatase family protein [Armatimonadota bacterium]